MSQYILEMKNITKEFPGVKALDTPASEQGPGMGGAMLAMVACGAYPSVQAVCDKLVKVADTVRPDPEIAARYEQRYEQFAKIYPALKGLYPQLL